MTKKTATNRKAEWNKAISEGRVMRSQGGLSFVAYTNRVEALEAVARLQLAGFQANMVEPSDAIDALASVPAREY